MTAEEIIRMLDLKPHPEGGFYRETYRSGRGIPGTSRVHSTGIYYLLTSGTVSKMHKLASDEIFHFYLGDPVTWVMLGPDGGVKKAVLGGGLEKGETVQLLIPAGTWFGGYLHEGGAYALMGTTVSPGFEFEDFVLGQREELLGRFPQAGPEISRLT